MSPFHNRSEHFGNYKFHSLAPILTNIHELIKKN
ncbi:unnamed protein product [Brassica rapa]|uniref:Uncharacterized protein n=1 Tax=Brassica campestris TaxID=3711 RepID=A0A3P6D2M2_BRACM|nr:unnamed protein product [Brassica rapa]VDD17031.1 unnamed protein product [Brassica rapa]